MVPLLLYLFHNTRIDHMPIEFLQPNTFLEIDISKSPIIATNPIYFAMVNGYYQRVTELPNNITKYVHINTDHKNYIYVMGE